MLSKNQIKFVRRLALKKHRDADGCFVAEGSKLVGELLGRFPCRLLCATAEFLESCRAVEAEETIVVDEGELQLVSQWKTPREVVAVFRKPETVPLSAVATLPGRELCLALDGVQDPGNVGTIVRLADWYGIEHIFASPDTADVFSPKTIQATMGAAARVKVHTVGLCDLIDALPEETPVYATALDGASLYAQPLAPAGLIVMGNEGNGVSPAVLSRANRRLFIPNFPPGRTTSESLNVALAAAIVCAEFRRRML